MRQRNIGKDIFMVAKAMTADERKSETEIHPQKLEPHFSEWMSRLTGERLHSKADIACVLAVLSIDLQAANEQIKRVREALQYEIDHCANCSGDGEFENINNQIVECNRCKPARSALKC